MAWLDNFTMLYWHWLAIGVALVVFEMVVPGTAMLWVGGAAALTGIITWLMPELGWQAQFATFAVFAIIGIVGSRRYLPKNRDRSEDPLLNNRYARLIGHELTLTSPIVNGHGRVPVDDGSFLVTGPDLPTGAKVRIVAVDGAVLVVESVQA